MMGTFADVLKEARITKEQMDAASTVNDLFRSKSFVLMPECVLAIIRDNIDNNRPFEELIPAFEGVLNYIGNECADKLIDLCRLVGLEKKLSTREVTIALKKVQGKFVSTVSNCDNKSCAYRRNCPVANRKHIDTAIDAIAVRFSNVKNKNEILSQLSKGTPNCFSLTLFPKYSVLLLEGKAKPLPYTEQMNFLLGVYQNKGDTPSELLEVLTDYPLLKNALLSEINKRLAEPSLLLSRIRESGLLDFRLVPSGTDPMIPLAVSAEPSVIWSGEDDDILAKIHSYIINHNCLPIEPYRYKTVDEETNGVIVWVGEQIFIDDDKIRLLSDLLQNHVLVTAYATSLMATLLNPNGAKVFIKQETSREKHARLNQNIRNVFSITRSAEGKSIRYDNLYSTVFSCLLSRLPGIENDFSSSSIYDLMKYYSEYYSIARGELPDSYDIKLSFDMLIGSSYLMPDSDGYVKGTSFSLSLTNAYDFSKTMPFKDEDNNLIAREISSGCSWYVVVDEADGKICDTILLKLYERDYSRRYCLKISYYGLFEGKWTLCLYSPSYLYDNCIDILTQASMLADTTGFYKLYSGSV